jgi:Branched-chain amino acid ABC-type transport system, permease components
MVGEPVFSDAILTRGLDVWYRTVLDNWIGVNPRDMGEPIFTWGELGSITIGGVVLKFQEIGALITAILAVVFLGYFFKVSKYGLAMRATSFDQEASLAQGIKVGRISGEVWFIAGILAAFSG